MSVVRVPDGLDPADYVLAGNDGEAFRALAAPRSEVCYSSKSTPCSASHDLQTVDGRCMRAFAVLRGVLGPGRPSASSVTKRYRYVADRLRAERREREVSAQRQGGRPSARDARLSSGGAANDARQRPARRSTEERVLMGTHELEVSFLAACLALPDPGRDYNVAIDEGFFSSEASRGAYRAVVERLGPLAAGKKDEGHGKVRDGGVADDGTMAAIVLRESGGRVVHTDCSETDVPAGAGGARRSSRRKAQGGRRA